MDTGEFMGNSHGILLYIACIALSATIYRFRHLLGMVIIILVGASWLWAAAMALTALQGNGTLRDQIQSTIIGVMKAYGVPNFNAFNTGGGHENNL